MRSGQALGWFLVGLIGVTSACADDDAATTDAGVNPAADAESFDAAPPECNPANAPPAQPTVTAPSTSQVLDVVPSSLRLAVSPFADPDGDAAGATELEIWTTTAGQLVTRVWHAELPGAAASAVLADGAFDPGFTALSDWSRYAARARHVDDRAGCPLASPWSATLAFRTDDGSASLFDDSVVRDLYIELPPASYDAINAQAIPPGCVPFTRSYYTGTVTFEGVVYQGVGVRTKGGCGSSQTIDQKPGWKINLNWDDPAVPGCPAADRRILGESHLTLNSQVQDLTDAHERLGYRLYRTLGVLAPRAAPIRVHLNGVYRGVYLHVETIDRRFLAHRFAEPDGMLYEGSYECDLIPANVPPDGDDSYCLTREFAPDACDTPDPGGDPEDYGPLRTFVDQIAALPPGGFYPEIEAFFDYDTFMSQWAVDGVMAQWDAYSFQIINNYRVYHDPTGGRWHMIPTGIDQTFGADQDPFYVFGVLATRCREEPDCEAAFAARVEQVLLVFQGLQLAAQAQAIFEQIKADVFAEPLSNETTFTEAHGALQQWIADRPAQVEQWLIYHGY